MKTVSLFCHIVTRTFTSDYYCPTKRPSHRTFFQYIFGCFTIIVFFSNTSLLAASTTPKLAWRLESTQLRNGQIKATNGRLPLVISENPTFAKDQPRAMIIKSTPSGQAPIVIAKKLSDINLPTKQISIEAWVRIDQPNPWAGIVSAVQDNGEYERGWVLGTHSKGSTFIFGLVSQKTNRITYLTNYKPIQLTKWHHVVGTYDGKNQRLYVDGKQVGQATTQSGDIAYPKQATVVAGAYQDKDECHRMNGQLDRSPFTTKHSQPKISSNAIDHKSNVSQNLIPIYCSRLKKNYFSIQKQMMSDKNGI